MSKIELKCQGLPCPQPVLQCKKAVEESDPQTLIVHVDNQPACENTTRFLTSKGYSVTSESKNKNFIVTAQKDGEATPSEQTDKIKAASPTGIEEDKHAICVFISTDVLGNGDDELGSKLMFNFLATLPELGEKLWRIILVNGAVRLAVEGSSALRQLQLLEQSGVSILVCGTCLEFFDILDKKQVGQTTNMLDVVTSLELAQKIIKI